MLWQDEITDDPSSDIETIQQRLSDWEHRFDMICRNEPIDDMDRALAMYIQRNDVELSPFIDMISGMQADSVTSNNNKHGRIRRICISSRWDCGSDASTLLDANVKNHVIRPCHWENQSN